MNSWTLVLAAGQSRRFGSPKSLAPWTSGTLIERAIEQARRHSGKNVLVVLGGHAMAVAPVLGMQEYTLNPRWEEGMGTSIAWGVRAIVERDPMASSITILPVDQPLIPDLHLQTLEKIAMQNQVSVLTRAADVVGPPVALPRAHFEKARSLSGSSGLKSVLAPDERLFVDCARSLQDADTPEDLARLRQQALPERTSVEIAAAATKLSLVEVILGSFVHGLNIPFGGQALSLNQGLFLCQATHRFRDDGRAATAPLQISAVSAVLKSLSPAGQKLGPMIAIGMQGFLYSLGILIFGSSRSAQSVGMFFLSLWAFVQPVVTLWLFYGNSLGQAFGFYYQRLQAGVPGLAHFFAYALMAVVILKVTVAISLPWLLHRFGHGRFEDLTERASDRASRFTPRAARPVAVSQWQAVIYTLRDLLKPGFLIPCLLISGFIAFSESDSAQMVWKILRPLAVATVFFYLSNTPWMHAFTQRLRKNDYFPQFFKILDLTKENLARRHRS